MIGMRASRKGPIVGAIALTVMAGAVGAYAATSSPATDESLSAAPVASVAPGPQRLLRADGAAAASAVPLFSLRNGDSVGLVVAGGSKCLVRTRGGKISGEQCAKDAGIGHTEGIAVTDECGAGGRQLMEITGLAPEGATSVRLTISDGGSRSTTVVDGAFKFDGTNPGPSDPYPTGVEWLEGAASHGSAELPVAGDQFCLPAE
jgi:hypothetical protein